MEQDCMEHIQYRRNRSLSKNSGLHREIFFIICMLITILFVTGYELKLLKTQLLIEDILRNGINYEAFREFHVSENSIKESGDEATHLLKKNPELKNILFIDQIGYFTFSMMARNFDLSVNRPVDEKTFCRGIGKVAATKG